MYRVICFLIIVVLLIGSHILEAIKSSSWKSTTAVVTAVHPDMSGDKNKTKLDYKYAADGIVFTRLGDTEPFAMNNQNIAPGTQFELAYNPSYPGKVLLHRPNLMVQIGALFFELALSALFYLFRNNRLVTGILSIFALCGFFVSFSY